MIPYHEEQELVAFVAVGEAVVVVVVGVVEAVTAVMTVPISFPTNWSLGSQIEQHLS